MTGKPVDLELLNLQTVMFISFPLGNNSLIINILFVKIWWEWIKSSVLALILICKLSLCGTGAFTLIILRLGSN